MMNMDRRTFFQRLAPLLVLPVVPRPWISREPTPDLAPPTEIWLAEWQAAKRIPITDSTDPLEQHLLRALRSGESLSLVYLGGTQPGATRQVRPALLYRVEGFSGVYLTAYCERRRAIRTFRLDQIRLPA